MATQGRTGFQQALTGTTTWDVLFDAATNGLPLSGVELSAQSQDVKVRITPLHVSNPDGTIASERLVAGATPVQRFAFKGVSGLISKIEAETVVAGGTVTWAPLMA